MSSPFKHRMFTFGINQEETYLIEGFKQGKMQSPVLTLPILGTAHVRKRVSILHLGQKQTPQAKQAASAQAKPNRCSQLSGQIFVSFGHVLAARVPIPTTRPGGTSRHFARSTLLQNICEPKALPDCKDLCAEAQWVPELPRGLL